MRTLLIAATALLASAPLAAQDDWEWDCDHPDRRERFECEQRPTGGFLGLSLTAGQMQGEFSEYVKNGIGGDLYYIHQLDRDGWIAIRADAGALIYGSERQTAVLAPRILVDVTTSNNMAWFGVGPQIGVPNGMLRPYAHGFVGYSGLWTSSSVSGTRYDDEEFASTTHFSDGGFSYGGGAGLYIPVRQGRSPVSIDLGVRYHENSPAEYLREGDIQDNPDGTITVYPVRSDTDLLTFHLGVSVGISRRR